MRLGNSLEVFDTSSSYINLRRILIYGKLSEKISFEIGDIDLKMTPFTLWNYQEEGNVNENSYQIVSVKSSNMKISIMVIFGEDKD